MTALGRRRGTMKALPFWKLRKLAACCGLGGGVVLATPLAAQPVTAAAPQNSALPKISGGALAGETVTANRGTWTGTPPITYTQAWQRCDSGGSGCNAIPGATSTSYKITSADLGMTLRVAVTATNNDGNTTASSDATPAVTTPSGKPASSAAPAVTGTATVGQALTTSTGNWTGDQPITYSYQWQRCDSKGNSCQAVPTGGAASSYTVVKADVDHTLRAQVQAKNSRGSSKALSEATAVVKAATDAEDIIEIGGGQKSAPVDSLSAGDRLIVKLVTFNPNPVTSRTNPIRAIVTVTDNRGYFVRGAWVFIRTTPILTEAVADQQTGTDGKTTFMIHPQANFPLKSGYNVQFFVKAYDK